MSDKFENVEQEEHFEQFVRNHIANILQCANLSHYYFRDLKKMRTKFAFTIDPDPVYLEFALRYNEDYAAKEITSNDYEDLLRTLCHEVTHIISSEIELLPKIKKLGDELNPLFERFTEHASRWLYQIYMDYVKERGIDVTTGLKKKK